MSVQRSPPGDVSQPQLIPPHTSVHYNSDSAINKNSNSDLSSEYFNVTKRHKRTFGDLEQHPAASISEIKAMIDDLKEQQDKKFDSFTNTLITIMEQNQGIHQSVTGLASQNKELLLQINKLEQENSEHKKRVIFLETKIDVLEKSFRSSSIEIRNLPKQSHESKKDLTNIVLSLGPTLGLDDKIQESEIRDIYRSKSEAIVVDFTTTLRKESLISKLKSFNKSKRESKEPLLNSGHFKIPGAQRAIFISEYLTAKARRIFYVARENVKNKKLAAAWTSFGRVYVKKKDGDSSIRIEDESDINKLLW